MKLTRLLLIALLFPIATQAKTGAQLRESCAAFGQPAKPGNEVVKLVEMSECIAYIDGVLDVPLVYQVQGGDDYCVPDGTKRGEIRNVAREAIRQPDVAKMTWPGSGSQVIFNALRAKWPCKATR
jgi:hypothetical protein